MKFTWQILIPTLIFAGILTIAGIAIEPSQFFWIQSFEMTYLFSTLLLGFAAFRIWRSRTSFHHGKEIRAAFYLLALVFAVDVTNTWIYLFEGHGTFLTNGTLAPAGAAFIGSLTILMIAIFGLQHQFKVAKAKA